MGIEGEDRAKGGPAHDLEAHTIDETQGSPRRQQMGAHGRLVNVLSHLNNVKDGHNVRFKNAERLKAQSPKD